MNVKSTEILVSIETIDYVSLWKDDLLNYLDSKVENNPSMTKTELSFRVTLNTLFLKFITQACHDKRVQSCRRFHRPLTGPSSRIKQKN